jgi:hypothetical protein
VLHGRPPFAHAAPQERAQVRAKTPPPGCHRPPFLFFCFVIRVLFAWLLPLVSSTPSSFDVFPSSLDPFFSDSSTYDEEYLSPPNSCAFAFVLVISAARPGPSLLFSGAGELCQPDFAYEESFCPVPQESLLCALSSPAVSDARDLLFS